MQSINSKFVTYAHRGASHYCPENTMMAFYMGMQMDATRHQSRIGKILKWN